MEEPKDPDICSIFSLYKVFATPDEINDLRQLYIQGGMGWGHAKQALYEKMNEELTPLRARYEYLMSHQDYIHEILNDGSHRAHKLATTKMAILRQIIGVT